MGGSRTPSTVGGISTGAIEARRLSMLEMVFSNRRSPSTDGGRLATYCESRRRGEGLRSSMSGNPGEFLARLGLEVRGEGETARSGLILRATSAHIDTKRLLSAYLVCVIFPDALSEKPAMWNLSQEKSLHLYGRLPLPRKPRPLLSISHFFPPSYMLFVGSQ